MRDYPAWICSDCGDKWGRRECHIATWHTDPCGICGKTTWVTEPRDFGHLKEGWQKERKPLSPLRRKDIETGRKLEREAIVKWLREAIGEHFAALVEAGEHLK